MELHIFELNIWGWILVVLQLLAVVLQPFLFGRERDPYSYSSWIGSLIGFALLLLALGVLG